MNKRLFNLRWFSIVFASLIMGIAFSVNLIAGIVFFFILSTLTLLLFLKDKRYLLISLVIISYLVGFLYASGLNYLINDKKDYDTNAFIIAKVDSKTKHDVDGKVTGVIILDDIRYDDVIIDKKATLYVKENSELHIGDEITFVGSIKHNTLVINSLNAVRPYLNGISYTINADRINGVVGGKLSFRDSIVLNAERVLFDKVDKDTAGFLSGMLFGDTSMIDSNVKTSARRLGIAHLFAVSGLHIGMIVGFIMSILKRFKMNRWYHLLILPLLIFYAYICNFSVSVLRATLMVTIYLLSNALFVRYDMLSSISFAGIVLLLVNPLYLFDISFVMSFMAVISIALFAHPINRFLNRKSDKYAVLKTAFASNIAVNIGLSPMTLYLFGAVSFLTLPANFLLIPLITIIFPVFFLIFILVMLLHLHFLVPIVALPFRLIVLVSKLVARINFVTINFDVSWYFVVAYIIVIILMSRIVFLDKKIKLVPTIAMILVLAVSLMITPINTLCAKRYIKGDKVFSSYTVVYEDKNYNKVLMIEGDVSASLLENAVAKVNSYGLGGVDAIVVPKLSSEQAILLEHFNETLGAKWVVTLSNVNMDNAIVKTSSEGIEINAYSDIILHEKDAKLIFVNPHNTKVMFDYYDAIIASNQNMKIENITPKYYINFAKDSQGESCSDFTFYIKNGKITLYNLL